MRKIKIVIIITVIIFVLGSCNLNSAQKSISENSTEPHIEESASEIEK